MVKVEKVVGAACGIALLALASCSTLAHSEEPKNFSSPEGLMFQDYRHFPPAVLDRAKVMFDRGDFKSNLLYKYAYEVYGFQAAEDLRFWLIRSELCKYTGGCQ